MKCYYLKSFIAFDCFFPTDNIYTIMLLNVTESRTKFCYIQVNLNKIISLNNGILNMSLEFYNNRLSMKIKNNMEKMTN